jgi:cytochrome c oxidase subunit 4
MNTSERALQPSSIGRVAITGAALLALAAVSYGLSFVPLGAFALAVALAIAASKALLVLWIFMQFGRVPPSAKLGALAAFFMLALLMSLMAADIASREPAPPAPPPAAIPAAGR